MKAYKKPWRGKGVICISILSIVLILTWISPLQATTWWDSGYHTINDGDTYGEIFLENDAVLDMFGGSALKIETLNFSTANILGGELETLWTNDDTCASIHAGTLNWLSASENSVVYLYAYDVTYHSSGGLYNNPWLEGRYYGNDNLFSFTFYHGEDDYHHINIVPEPTSILFLGFGSLLLRRRNTR